MAGFRSLSPGLRALQPEAFGADPSGERLARIRRSPHFKDGVFQNPGGIGARIRPSGSGLDIAKAFLDKDTRPRRSPSGPIPVHPTTLADLAKPPATGLRLTWMGHSSVLAEIDGHRVLFDPVWGERCSPSPSRAPSGCTRPRCRWPRSARSTSWSSRTTTTTTWTCPRSRRW